MMTPRRRLDAPVIPSPWEWMKQLSAVWPVLVFVGLFLTGNLVMQWRTINMQIKVDKISTRQDSSQVRSERRDYMNCRMFEMMTKMMAKLSQDTAGMHTPKFCDQAFQDMGYR